MSDHRRSSIPALLLAAVLALGGCQRGAAADPARPTAPSPTRPPASTPPAPDDARDGLRTVVEHDLDGAVLVIEVVEIGADRAATMVVRADGGAPEQRVRVIEEILVGDDHYVYAPDAEAVFGVDLWIHVDLTDPRQRSFLEEQGPGLFARAESARAGDAPGVRVERERVRRPPIERPSGRIVSLPDVDELVPG